MKEKKLGYISMIAMLVLSMVIMIAPARSGVYPGGAGCTIWVDDQAAHFGPSPDPGNLTCTTDFNVSINLQNAPASPGGVAAWEFKLSYNSTLLNASYVYRPPAWPEPPYTWLPKGADMLWHPDSPPTINNTAGYVWVGCSIPGGSELSGNWTLVTIKFHIMYAPTRVIGSDVWANSSLNLYATKLKDAMVVDIPHSLINGTYTYGRPAIVAGWPLPSFTWAPLTPYELETVQFTSTSTDPMGYYPLTFAWDLDADDVFDDAFIANPTWSYATAGAYMVGLNVTNSLGNWANCSNLVTVIKKIGPVIDLYDEHDRQYPEGTWTPYIGIGANVPGDSYAPGENVTLFALVTYNEEPVQNILVGFEVLDPRGLCVIYRVARTNDVGIATVWFRIPIPCDPAEQELLFGHWLAIAKCKLQDAIINDTKPFMVGWIVSIIDLNTFPSPYYWYKGQIMYFNITLKNIAFIPRAVWVVVVVYDECDVPIFQTFDWFNITGGIFCHPNTKIIELSYEIPKWAYVGKGKVYANAFTARPQDCGIPYCPEVMYPIEILKTP